MEITFYPRFLIRLFKLEPWAEKHLNILLSSITILVFLPILGQLLQFSPSSPSFCLVNNLFSIPCPGCGITRSLSALFSGDLFQSLRYNYSGIVLGFYLTLQIPLRTLVMGNKKYEFKIDVFSKVLGKLVLFAIFANWLFTLTLKL